MKEKNIFELADKDEEFQEILKDILENKEVQKMKIYKIHGETNCYDHCYAVSYLTYLACKKRKLDYKSAARAAMLHDFYLYDWHDKNSHVRPHAFTHPMTAYLNAKKQFELNWMEKDMILTHMFPVTLFTVPLCYEGWILTMVDKTCATMETFENVAVKVRKKARA